MKLVAVLFVALFSLTAGAANAAKITITFDTSAEPAIRTPRLMECYYNPKMRESGLNGEGGFSDGCTLPGGWLYNRGLFDSGKDITSWHLVDATCSIPQIPAINRISNVLTNCYPNGLDNDISLVAVLSKPADAKGRPQLMRGASDQGRVSGPALAPDNEKEKCEARPDNIYEDGKCKHKNTDKCGIVYYAYVERGAGVLEFAAGDDRKRHECCEKDMVMENAKCVSAVKEFSIVYDPNNWNKMPDGVAMRQKCAEGETFTLAPAPEKKGYDFAGWKYQTKDRNGGRNGPIYTTTERKEIKCDQDFSIAAQWEKAGSAAGDADNAEAVADAGAVGEADATAEQGGAGASAQSFASGERADMSEVERQYLSDFDELTRIFNEKIAALGKR
ncbi:MAG: InlB B-repeat-containing protein [Rickettsiales bacterium]|nr:InlB B-repeat-containing protein [Rickettsiales bacterium]